MKRHEQLQDLSREHYSALKLALYAKRAAVSGDPAQIRVAAKGCRLAFDSELEAHFLVEERDLLPRLRAAGQTALVSRTEADHAELRGLVTRLEEADRDVLLAFSERLTAHVRFEEREMFEAMEALLAAA